MKAEMINLELHRAEIAMAQGLTIKAQKHIDRAANLLNE